MGWDAGLMLTSDVAVETKRAPTPSTSRMAEKVSATEETALLARICDVFHLDTEQVLSASRGGVIASYARQCYMGGLHLHRGYSLERAGTCAGRKKWTVQHAARALESDTETDGAEDFLAALASGDDLALLKADFARALEGLRGVRPLRRKHLVSALASAGRGHRLRKKQLQKAGDVQPRTTNVACSRPADPPHVPTGGPLPSFAFGDVVAAPPPPSLRPLVIREEFDALRRVLGAVGMFDDLDDPKSLGKSPTQMRVSDQGGGRWRIELFHRGLRERSQEAMEGLCDYYRARGLRVLARDLMRAANAKAWRCALTVAA